MTEVVTTGFVEKGHLTIRNREAFRGQLRHLRGEVVVTVERKHAIRSLEQNAYWWGVCVHLVSEHTGYTPNEVHELTKQMFLPKKLCFTDDNGVVKGEYVIGGTTTRLNKIQFGEFIEAFRRWAAEDLGVIIPDPA
jgi:hypothetical protein